MEEGSLTYGTVSWSGHNPRYTALPASFVPCHLSGFFFETDSFPSQLRALLLTLHRDSTPTVNAFRLATPMDTRVSPLERGEERNGEKTESEELEGTESHRGGGRKRGGGGGAGDYKRRKIYNPRMKFIRTSHLPLSTLRRLQRASSYSFLSLSLSFSSIYASLVPRPIDTTLPLFLSLLRALLSDNRKGRGADSANKRYPAPS